MTHSHLRGPTGVKRGARDMRLAVAINKPPIDGGDPGRALRLVLVGRLADEPKGVMRAARRARRPSLYCEQCGRWTPMRGEWAEKAWPVVVRCGKCGCDFEMEAAIYTTRLAPAAVPIRPPTSLTMPALVP